MKNIRLSLILLAASVWPAAAQVWDNTGNFLLNGQTYYFREVTITQNDAFAAYGTMTFSNGSYTTNAIAIEDQQGEEGAYTPSGTFSIAASGFGFINAGSGSLLQSPIYGLVGANGVFVGSSTESGNFDIFIAAPLTSQSTGTLNGAYSISYTDPLGGLTGGTPYGGLLQLTANGGGQISGVNLQAYATSSTPSTQSIGNFNYISSGGAFVLNFPTNSTNLVQGQEYLYSTPDGSFVFGGSPQNFDMLVGVNTAATQSAFGGLYYTAGFQVDNSQLAAGGSSGYSSYYGSFNAANGVILAHQRIQDFAPTAFGYTYADSYTPSSGANFTDSFLSVQFIGGNASQIGVGIGPFPGVSVALQAPTPNVGGSVVLSPMGVVNSASYSPFTSGISRGEYITLTGTNLGPSTLQVASVVPFPTELANVKVLINGVAAPIYYVSASQLAVLVPNETNQTIAEIQVINNGTGSNVVTELVNETTPGVFSQTQDGIGYGAVEHQDGTLVTPDSPAEIGETVSAFIAGLGDTLPELLDGTAASTTTLTDTSNAITGDISGTSATVSFAGLAPGFVGLYQVNLVIPAGVSAGDNFLDIAGPDSYNSEALISISSAAAAVPAAHAHRRTRPHAMTPRPALSAKPARVAPPQ